MSNPPIPPQAHEQFTKLREIQQSLQNIANQQSHLESEKAETGLALEELKKAADGDTVYKNSGIILVKSSKGALISELEEKLGLVNTRITVSQKQRARIEENLKECQTKLSEMLKNIPGLNQQQQQQP